MIQILSCVPAFIVLSSSRSLVWVFFMTMSKRVNGISLLSVGLLEHFLKLATNLADKMSLGRLCQSLIATGEKIIICDSFSSDMNQSGV